MRRSIWSVRSGMVCAIFNLRRWLRVEGCEYALSARSRDGSLRDCGRHQAAARARDCRRPGRRSAAVWLGYTPGRPGRGSWWSSRRGSVPARGRRAHRADPCNSDQPPVRRAVSRRRRAGARGSWWSRSRSAPATPRPRRRFRPGQRQTSWRRCRRWTSVCVVPIPLPGAELGGQIPPRRAGLEPPGDSLQRAPMVVPRSTTTPSVGGKDRLDHGPQVIRDRVSSKHPTTLNAPRRSELADTP